MTRSMDLSLFAGALARLLDDTGVYTRAEWAKCLRVPEQILADWVSDKGFPTYDRLRMILDIVQNTAGVSAQPAHDFEMLTLLPIAEVTPFASVIGKNLDAYLGQTLEDATLLYKGLDPNRIIELLQTSTLRLPTPQ